MEVRNKYAMWLAFFGLLLTAFGEISYTIVAKFIVQYEVFFHHLYYVLIAASLLVCSFCFYKMSYKYKVLQRLFEGLMFYFIAKFGNELLSRATEYSTKELIYWGVLIAYVIYRIVSFIRKS